MRLTQLQHRYQTDAMFRETVDSVANLLRQDPEMSFGPGADTDAIDLAKSKLKVERDAAKRQAQSSTPQPPKKPVRIPAGKAGKSKGKGKSKAAKRR